MKTKVAVIGLDRNREPMVKRLFVEVRPAYTLTPLTVVDAYADGGISEQEGIDRLAEMGYRPREAVLWLSFMVASRKSERREAEHG